MNTKLNKMYEEILDNDSTRISGYNKFDEELDDLLESIRLKLCLIENGEGSYNLLTVAQVKSMMWKYWECWDKYKSPKSFILKDSIDIHKPITSLDINSSNSSLLEFMMKLTDVDGLYCMVDRFKYLLYNELNSYITIIGDNNYSFDNGSCILMSSKALDHVDSWNKTPKTECIIFTDEKMNKDL